MVRSDKNSRAGRITETELANLLREHYAFVFHYLLKITMDRPVAEDMAQETMIRAIERIDRYDGSSKFSTWLITIELGYFWTSSAEGSGKPPF